MSSQAPGHQAPSSEPSAATRQPLLNTTAPAINAAPIELDSTPVSPVAKQHSWPRGGAPAGAPAREGSAGALSPQEKEKRNSIIKERSKDPAVVVDVPEEPGADELAAAEEEEGAKHANAA